MSLQISSQATLQAPSGAPNSRRTIGVGEPMVFRANAAAQWTLAGTPRSGQHRELADSFPTPGVKTVIAQAAEERAIIEITVVAPSIRVDKVNDVPWPPGRVRAEMQLRFVLTPLEVSFGALQFRERECDADNTWGYFQHQRPQRHTVTPGWHPVDRSNQVVDLDTTAFELIARNAYWPITSGGYRWLIPDEYQIGQQTFSFDRPMTQTVRLDTRDPILRPPFRGSITVWKGGKQIFRAFT